MDERTVTMMEGVAREWRVRVQDAAGNVLDPAGFSFYGGAADGVQVPRRMQVRVDGDVAVLVLPGLWMSGRCWRYQVLCQDVLTGVEWVLCQGDVVLERRVACNGPALHEDAVLVDAVLDSEMTKVDVVLGDSTAATGEAARRAEMARDKAEAGAARAEDAAAKAEALKGVALDVAAGAVLSAEGAEDSKRGAEAAAGDAAADAQVAAGKAEEARVSAQDAEAAARGAQGKAEEAKVSAQDALANKQEAEQAAQDAAQAQVGAERAKADADAASKNAAQKATEATESANQAAADKTEAEKAKIGAQAAQGAAEEQAAIATAAAEAAQAPESIAVQAARPAVMVLVRQELAALLGDSAAWVVDTDGEKVVVHTDRLEGELLAAVEDVLERFVPGFIGLRRHNHDFSIPWQELPDGYVVVDYLSKDANQYFKFTEGLGTTEDDTEIDFTRYVTEGGMYSSILTLAFVCPDSFKSASIGYNINSGDSNVSTLFQTTYYAADGTYTYPSQNATCGYFHLNNERVTARFSERVCYFNGERKGVIDTEYFLPVCPIGAISIFIGKHIARIYGLRHRSNETGAQLLDLIPCVDDTGAPCLFDRVTRVSFYNAGAGDFSYPGKEEEATTYSLRRPVMYGQLTAHGVRRLYHVPQGYNGTREEYAAEFGFKPLVETVEPEPVEGVVWEPHWRETEEELVLEWVAEEVNG